MYSQMKINFIVCFSLLSSFCLGQVEISPRVSLNKVNYDLHLFNNVDDDPLNYSIGLGLGARLKLSDRINFIADTDFYLSEKIFHADYVTASYTIGFSFFDFKLGLEKSIYENTFLGIGLELEQLLNIREFNRDNPQSLIRGFQNRKQLGIEFWLRQRIGRVEIFGGVFISVYSKFEAPVNTKSHEKFQIGIGFPISIK